MKTLRITLKIIGGLFMILLIVAIGYYLNSARKVSKNLEFLGEEAPTLDQNGISFRDLNKNGKLDIYENKNASIADRVDDLVGQMTIEEKAGTMFITIAGMRSNGEPYETPFFPVSLFDIMTNVMLPRTSDLVAKRLMNSFNIINSYDAHILARYNNNLQRWQSVQGWAFL